MGIDFHWSDTFRDEREMNGIVEQVKGAIEHEAEKCSCGKITVRVQSKDPLNVEFRAEISCLCGAKNIDLHGKTWPAG